MNGMKGLSKDKKYAETSDSGTTDLSYTKLHVNYLRGREKIIQIQSGLQPRIKLLEYRISSNKI